MSGICDYVRREQCPHCRKTANGAECDGINKRTGEPYKLRGMYRPSCCGFESRYWDEPMDFEGAASWAR